MMKKKLKKKDEIEIDWDARLDKLEEQLGIYGAFRDKPCCNKCAGSKTLRTMTLTKNKRKYVCPRCGNMLKAEDFKRYMKKCES